MSLWKRLFGGKTAQALTSQGGFNADFWSDHVMGEKWAELAQAGPEYASPLKRTTCASPLADCPGTLYVALYPRDKFENLVHFQIYHFFTSSVQQILIETGEVDLEWFYPEEKDDGVALLRGWANTVMNYPQGPSMPECLAQVGLPASLQWVNDLNFDAWAFDREEACFEVQAASAEGYLVMFIVDG